MVYEYDQNWHGNQVPTLTEKFLPLWEGRKGLRVLEIGSFEGRSTKWWLENLDVSKMVCVDNWEGGVEHALVDMDAVFNNFKENVGDEVETRKGNSHDKLMEMVLEGTHEFDFIYVDGSHMGKDVMFDAFLADRMLVPGGIMLFDDYQWPAQYPAHHKPKQAIDFFFNMYLDYYENVYVAYQACIRKKKKMDA